MSEIRTLLANAQAAELRGEKEDAARLLREAASWYRDRQQLRRAAQMLRQARRVEGLEDDSDAVFGFGAEFEGEVVAEPLPEVAVSSPGRELLQQRGPQLADPSVDAWCSFCCRPKAEVGALIAGPAGAFVCRGCVEKSAALHPARLEPHRAGASEEGATERDRAWAESPTVATDRSQRARGPGQRLEILEVRTLPHELPAQRRARERFLRLRARLSLVIGPTGAGKSAWLDTVRGPDVRQVELDARLTADDEADLLGWLEAPARAAFLVVRAAVPPAALVLQGAHGPEPIHDTATLAAAIPHASAALLRRVDAVHAFELPDEVALGALARALAASRGVTLPGPALERLVALALRAGTGAHELVTLLARIPPGTYDV